LQVEGAQAIPPAAPSRAYAWLLATLLFLFLLLSDWIVLGGPLLAVRRGLVAALAAASLPFALRHRRAFVRSLAAPPLGFIAGFLVLGLAFCPTALTPAGSAVHTLAFAGLAIFAVTLAATLPAPSVLALIRLAVSLKLAGSLAIGFFVGKGMAAALVGPPGGSLAYRHSFGGLFGNPNPLCDAAALYLLLVACDLIERGREWRSLRYSRVVAGWYLVTVPIAAYLMWQSLSRSAWLALLIVAVVLGLLAQWRASRHLAPVRRRLMMAGTTLASLLAVAALLVWLDVSRGVIHSGVSLAERVRHAVSSGAILDAAERPQFWEFALERIGARPWTGYGMASTPLLYGQRFEGRPEHSHNLELEAALYVGIAGALLVVLFAATTLRRSAAAFLARGPCALSTAATLLLLLVLAQVEPMILGSPYPGLLIVLVLAAQLPSPADGGGVKP
jgi:O-antigen ligase